MIETQSKNSIIQIFRVYKKYGGKNALTDVTLDIPKNDSLLISGPSGAGKTTLLKLLYLDEKVSAGQVLVDGMNLARISRKRIPFLRRKLGIIFQDYKLIPTKTVFDNVAIVLEAMGKKRRLIQKKVKNVLRTVGMEERINSFPPILSGGEQQRVAVARAVVGDPIIILADKPTGSLDSDSADIIIKLLKKFHTRGTTLVIATHDKELLNKIGGRIVHLKQGCLQPSA